MNKKTATFEKCVDTFICGPPQSGKTTVLMNCMRDNPNHVKCISIDGLAPIPFAKNVVFGMPKAPGVAIIITSVNRLEEFPEDFRNEITERMFQVIDLYECNLDDVVF